MVKVQAVSDYYVLRQIQKVAENANTVIADYNEKYVKKAVETSRQYVTDVSKTTKERFEQVMEESKKVMAKVPMLETLTAKVREAENAASESYVVKQIQKATETAQITVRDYNEKYVKKVIDQGREVITDVARNTKEAVRDIVDDGKRIVVKVNETAQSARDKAKAMVDARIEAGLGYVAKKMSLPDKKDIQRLSRAIEAFNKKMDSLEIQPA